ncbi:hypothetical protein [Planktothricoides raciborskii]|uniref:Uncharacterized protein n=1 Tax=Planktothricoides raciborskii GIHE-MW2 TaxID=2792601 RepID=A0AAU8JIW9_9CYAN
MDFTVCIDLFYYKFPEKAIASLKRNRVSALTVASQPKFWLRNPVSEHPGINPVYGF